MEINVLSVIRSSVLYAVFGWIYILTLSCSQEEEAVRPPNILFCISDDQSFPHASAYGCDWVNTPSFDRVAASGILFTQAYTPNAKCAPSRAILLTGRNSWQLEEAGNHVPYFPLKYKTYAEVLLDRGYHTGWTGKGWAPGDPGKIDGQPRHLLGRKYGSETLTPPTKQISNNNYAANFKKFLQDRSPDQPFCFWYGATEPHRRYSYRSGVEKGGKSLEDIDRVFSFWPDTDTVRNDMLDYAFEIEHFDNHLGQMMAILEEMGELDNTIIVVTSDNGMPFPRLKGQSYEYSNHLPLAIMWPKGIKNPGRRYDKFVSFADIAPTFLAVAGIVEPKSGMQPIEGNNLMPVFKDKKFPDQRNYMVIGKERHDLGRPNDEGYPMRGIRQDSFLYIKNYKTDRWPAGNPETGYMNCDGSPTKSYILNLRRRMGSSVYWDLSFGKRGSEELYNVVKDPECMDNLIDNASYETVRNNLYAQMEKELKQEKDPRILGNGDIFDHYPYSQSATRNFYSRFMNGEDIKANWINQTDIDTDIE
ncbi:sulfatase [Membranihabitans marinus]